MIEYSVNSEGQLKLEVMEAKLLRAYEDLNRVEVERKRIEQIVKACEKNPPNNEEQIRVTLLKLIICFVEPRTAD